MLSNDKIKGSGIRRNKASGSNNLPGAKATKLRWGPKYPLRMTAKFFAWQYAVRYAGSETRLVLNREWGLLGITPKLVTEEVMKRLPEFQPEWDVYNRLWYMYTERMEDNTPIACISKEHPLRSQILLPYTHKAIDLYCSGRKFTEAQVKEEFGL